MNMLTASLITLILLCISVLKAKSNEMSVLTQVLSQSRHDSCDLFVLKPKQLESLDEKVIFVQKSGLAKVLADVEGLSNLQMFQYQSTCQLALLRTANYTDIPIIDRILALTKSPLSGIVLTNNQQLTSFPRKVQYTLDVIHQDKELAKYSPTEDPRWRTFRVAWAVMRPYLYVKKDGTAGGIDMEVWNMIGTELGIKLVLGPKSPSFVAMYTAVPYRQAELALMGTALSHDMLRIGDPSHFSFFEVYKFYNRKPGRVTPFMTLAYPFDGLMWLCVLVSFVFATFAVYLVNLKVPLSLFHTLQIVLSTIISDTLGDRVFNQLKKNWYGYTVVIIWFMCGFLISAAYASNLLASLLVVEMKAPDNTFEDLVKNGRTLCVPNGSLTGLFMQTSHREIVLQAERECVSERGGYYNFTQTGVLPPKLHERMENGEASSFLLESQFYPYFGQWKYHMSTEISFATFSTYYMQHGHPLKPAIDDLLDKATDYGILHHIHSMGMWTEGATAREDERLHAADGEDELVKISTSHLIALWILSGFGTTVASIAFVFELFRASRNRISLAVIVRDETVAEVANPNSKATPPTVNEANGNFGQKETPMEFPVLDTKTFYYSHL